jgi:uncharacterized membrane protein YeaQ/YmgE (transglycosylase-associated protein family)
MHLLYIILVGFLAGWLARYVLKARKHGVLIDIVLGILGAVAGGFLFGILGFASHGFLSDVIVAFVGAVVLIVGYRALTRS